MSAGDDFSTSFSFDLDSNLSEVANDNVGSLYELQEALRAGSEELRGMQTVLRQFKGTAGANSETVKQLSDKISAQKAVLASASQSYAKLGVSYAKAKNPADALKQAQEASTRQFLTQASAQARLKDRWHEGYTSLEQYRLAQLRAGKAAEAMKLQRSTAMLASVRAAALGVAVAYVAVAAAEAAAGFALLQFGVMAANTRRSELLHLEGLSKLRYGYYAMFGAMGPAADKASFLQSTIDQVSDSVALGRGQVMGYTEQLYKMQLRGGNLQAALEGVTTIAATQGDAAAQAWLGMAYGSALTGKSIRALADDVKARLGPIAAAQMLDWNIQTQKLHEKFERLFSGLRLDKLLAGLNKVTGMFATSRAEGAALKQLIEVIFQPLIDFAGGTGALLVKRFIQGMIILTQQLVLVALRVRGAWLDAFGSKKVVSDIDLFRGAVLLGAAAVASLLFLAFAAVLPIVLLGLSAYGAYKFVDHLVTSIQTLNSELRSLVAPSEGAGAGMAKGIASGILGGKGEVAGAMLSVSKAALDAFLKHNDIHSPSRLYRKKAYEIPRGKALGIEDGAPLVREAMLKIQPESEGMPRAVAAGAAGASAASAGRPVVLQFGDVIAQGSSAREQAEDFKRQLEIALSDTTIQLGARPA